MKEWNASAMLMLSVKLMLRRIDYVGAASLFNCFVCINH